jgi:CheY-like chemotaxis protein
MHGGTVRAESEGQGLGSTFVVRLPAQASAALAVPVPVTPPPAEPHHDLGGISVLVVDDEADARDLLQRLLQDAGASVRTAGSAAEALAQLRAVQPDVLVSDIGMPEVDGYQLMQLVRALPPQSGGRVPAIALTAFARDEDRARALAAGFDAHLAKPLEPGEVCARCGGCGGRWFPSAKKKMQPHRLVA